VPRTFSSLRHANFRLLWFTSVINAGSNWIQQVTLGWLAYDLTGSALTAAIVFGMRSLPNLLIGPIGGVFGDRFERRKGLMINSGYMSVLAVGFATLLATGTVATWHLLVFTLLQGIGQSLVGPVRQALVANTVPREELMNAIALNAFAQNAMRVIGPAIAGVLIAVFGPALNFGIQGVSYVLVFILVLPLKTPFAEYNPRARHHASIRESFVQGISYVRTQPTILGLLLMALVPTLFTTPVNRGLLPVWASAVLNVDSMGLGVR
jgi:MFS family permease